ncbi:hypothetical protein PENTCL1PPCAC_3582, partial [Pristionchus entomophagus]
QFRASNVSRVLMSAASFGHGLFWKTPDQKSPVIPPIYTSDDDPMLHPPLSCTNYWDDVIRDLKLDSNVNVSSAALQVLEATKWPKYCKERNVPSEKADAIVSELPNRHITMPREYNECAADDGKKFMYNVSIQNRIFFPKSNVIRICQNLEIFMNI